MHRARIGNTIIKNEEAIKYAFQPKEAYVVLFFEKDKESLKEGLIESFHHLGIPSINNQLTNSVIFKLSSFEEAEGFSSVVGDVFQAFGCDILSNPVFPNEKNWLMNENSVIETFIGTAVFDGPIHEDYSLWNIYLEKAILELQKETIANKNFDFYKLREYFTHHFVNFNEKEFIDSIVNDTMEHTEFFKDEESARSFVEQTFDALSENDYRQLGFLEFRLHLLCEQIKLRLESKEDEKVLFESVFKKAIQNTGHVNSERMFELPSKSIVTQSLPVQLFATESFKQKVSKNMFNEKEKESTVQEYFENSLSFEKTYLEIVKGHLKHIQNPKVDSIPINSIAYVNTLYKIMDSYFTMKAGFSLFNQIIKQSKTVPEKSFKEFVDSFELK